MNIQELENIVFKEREACVCNIWIQGENIKEIENIVKDLKTHELIIDITY